MCSVLQKKILHTLDDKMQTGGIYCDIKVFDCVNNGLLLLKVNLYGI
jgi:hypothetical protein